MKIKKILIIISLIILTSCNNNIEDKKLLLFDPNIKISIGDPYPPEILHLYGDDIIYGDINQNE